ncbi:MAG: GntR family transcriptional regulator [Thermoplasmata archaeon]
MSKILTITLNPDTDTPLYRQIYDQIIENIAIGNLKEGSALPSLREMAGVLDVNYHTVNEAYENLRRDGFITLSKNKKYTVSLLHNDKLEKQKVMQEIHKSILKALALGMRSEEIDRIVRKFMENPSGGMQY